MKNKNLSIDELELLIGNKVWIKSNINNKVYESESIAFIDKKYMLIYFENDKSSYIRYELNKFYLEKP